jgi:hypothetical protein
VNLGGSCLHGKEPIAWRGIFRAGDLWATTFGSRFRREQPANSIILAADQPEDVSQRTFLPGHFKPRRLQAGGSARNITADSNRTGEL